MCPDWESNQRPFGSQAGAQSTKQHQPGQKLAFFPLVFLPTPSRLCCLTLFLRLFQEGPWGPIVEDLLPVSMASCCSARPGALSLAREAAGIGDPETDRQTETEQYMETKQEGERNQSVSHPQSAVGRPQALPAGSLEKSNRHKRLLTSLVGTLVAFVCVGCRAASAWPQSPEPGAAGTAFPWGLGQGAAVLQRVPHLCPSPSITPGTHVVRLAPWSFLVQGIRHTVC